MSASAPARSIPKVFCDLNACGLSDEPDDNCYYGLSRDQLGALNPSVGMRVFIWDWSDATLIIGCEALLEPFYDFWRARPVIPDTWYEGLPDDTFIT